MDRILHFGQTAIFFLNASRVRHVLYSIPTTHCTLVTMVESGVVHVGEAPSNFPSCWELTTVCFHGFADLPHEKGSSIKSSIFQCLGHAWYLMLYPGGMAAKSEEGEDAIEERIALLLAREGYGSINVQFCFNIKGFTDSKVFFTNKCFHGKGWGYGCKGWFTRKVALTHLVKGSFVIEVWMRLQHPTTFIPPNPSSISFLASFFMDKKSADVVFKIGGETETVASRDEPPMKMQKTSMITLSAHRCILMKMAPTLAALLGSNMSPAIVELPNDSVQAFKSLLRYIYGLEIFDIGNDIGQIKDILELANKYGVVNLKLEMEELLVSSISLNVDNFIDHLTYAESKNCALLKETVMDFIIKKRIDIHASKKFANIPDDIKENLWNDIIMAMAIKVPSDDGDGKGRALDTMNIRELRQKAYDKNLDVDGSRETLISLLK